MLGILIFIVLPFYYILKKWLMPKKTLKAQIGVTCLFFVAVLFLCGYKIPWFDKYPKIKWFPDHSNKKEIEIRVIKTLSEFTKSDSLHYPIKKDVYCCNGTAVENNNYTNNLKNISYFTSRVKSNDFEFSNSFINGLKGIGSSGGSTSPKSGNSNNWDFHFTQNTIDYNKIKIGKKETIFKGTSNLLSFYQVNYPKSEKDTLYFIYDNLLSKAYIIK